MLLSDERVDNITGDSQAVAVEDEEQFVPANSPFEVLLNEVPLQEEPTSVVAVIADLLDGAVNDSQTTITVEHGDWFQDGDTLLVDTEQMTVNAAPTGNSVPVDRGANGTTPAAHSDGADVRILNSLTEVLSDTPAAREFVLSYEKGWARFNSDQANMRTLWGYQATGSLVTVKRQIHILPEGDDFPERPGVGMVVAKGGMVFWYNGAAWAPFSPLLETDTTVNTFSARGLSNLTWGDLVSKTIYVPAAGATVGAIGRMVAKNTSGGAESFQLRLVIDGTTGTAGDAVSTPASGYRRASATGELAVTGGRFVTVKIQGFANVTGSWEHQRSELFLWTTPWEGE